MQKLPRKEANAVRFGGKGGVRVEYIPEQDESGSNSSPKNSLKL
jgi:hypothetical protein